MKLRTRMVAVGLLASAATVMAAGASTATTQPPARAFSARYRGTYGLVSPVLASITSAKGVPALRAPVITQDIRMSAHGRGVPLGASRLSGVLHVGQGFLCRPMSGSAVMTSRSSPSPSHPRQVRVSLRGALCSSLEGNGSSISGSYRVVSPVLAGQQGSGSIVGRCYQNGALILFLKGSI